MTQEIRFGPGGRFLIIAAAAVIVIAGLRAAAAVLVPLVLALFLAALSAPLLKLLPRVPGLRWIPHGFAVILTALVVVAIVGGAAAVLTLSVRMLVSGLPAYKERLIEAVAPLFEWAQRVGLDTDAMRDLVLAPSRALDLARSVVGGALTVVSDMLLILLLYVFILLGVPSHGDRLRSALGDEAPERVRHMLEQTQRYLRLKSAISLLNGLGIGFLTWALGIDFALLWGFLMFLLNFIPNLGSIVGTALPALLALATRGPATVVLLVLGSILWDQILSRVVEPRMMGRSLGLPPLVVVVSLLFWGWLWGPLGVFLAVPLTTTLKIVVAETSDLRWLAVLGSDESGSEPVS